MKIETGKEEKEASVNNSIASKFKLTEETPTFLSRNRKMNMKGSGN